MGFLGLGERNPVKIESSLWPGIAANLEVDTKEISTGKIDKCPVSIAKIEGNRLLLNTSTSNRLAAQIDMETGQVFGSDGKQVLDNEGKPVFLTEDDKNFLIKKAGK